MSATRILLLILGLAGLLTAMGCAGSRLPAAAGSCGNGSVVHRH